MGTRSLPVCVYMSLCLYDGALERQGLPRTVSGSRVCVYVCACVRTYEALPTPSSSLPPWPGSLRIQSEIASSAKAQYSGVFQTILKVAKDEGVLKLWSGVSPQSKR